MPRQTKIIDCKAKETPSGMEYEYILTDAIVRVEVAPEANVWHTYMMYPSKRCIKELRAEIREHIIPFMEETFDFTSGYICTPNLRAIDIMCDGKKQYLGDCRYGPVYEVEYKDV